MRTTTESDVRVTARGRSDINSMHVHLLLTGDVSCSAPTARY